VTPVRAHGRSAITRALALALAAALGAPGAGALARADGHPPAAAGDPAVLALVPLREEEAALRGDRLHADPAARARWVDLIRRYGALAAAHPSADESMEPLLRAAALSADLHRISRAAPDLDEALRLYRAADALDAAHPLAAAACLRGALLEIERGDDAGRAAGGASLAACATRHAGRPEGAEARRLLDMLRGVLPAEAARALDPAPLPVGPSGIPGEVIDTARLAIPAAAAPALLGNVSRFSAATYTRLVIQLDRPAHFTAGEAAAGGGLPARLFVDVQDARLAPELPAALPAGDGLLRTARIAMFTRTTARVVLDLDAVKRFRVFPLDEPFRIVVDLFGEAADAGDVAAAGVPPAVAGLEKALGTGGASLAARAGLKVKRIVLDAGHGGDDTGAVAASGLAEKDVNLALALELAPILRTRLGVEVKLTRETDVHLALEERTAIANAARGDLLVSIHCNSAPDASARGIEVYYLDIASDDYARRAAARENAASAKGLAELPAVLSELVTRANAEESKALAGAIDAALFARVDATHRDAVDRGVRGALFYVLLGARMPGVLVETSFLSSPKDAERLARPEYRSLVAAGIADGVAAFIRTRGL